MSPLPQAYDNNLVQICPKHAIHDIVPAAKRHIGHLKITLLAVKLIGQSQKCKC